MKKRETGATLLVVLVMLVVLTLLGIAGIKMSSSSLLAVGNLQARKFTENYASQAIEQVMNGIAPFNSPDSAFTFTGAPAGLTIVVSNRTCLFSAPASGYSAVSALAPEDDLWEFRVRVTDTFTGAQTIMWEGAKIRMLNGSCPDIASPYPNPT